MIKYFEQLILKNKDYFHVFNVIKMNKFKTYNEYCETVIFFYNHTISIIDKLSEKEKCQIKYIFENFILKNFTVNGKLFPLFILLQDENNFVIAVDFFNKLSIDLTDQKFNPIEKNNCINLLSLSKLTLSDYDKKDLFDRLKIMTKIVNFFIFEENHKFIEIIISDELKKSDPELLINIYDEYKQNILSFI